MWVTECLHSYHWFNLMLISTISMCFSIEFLVWLLLPMLQYIHTYKHCNDYTYYIIVYSGVYRSSIPYMYVWDMCH